MNDDPRSAPSGLAWTLHDDPPAADAALVDAGLGAANLAAAPLHAVQPLACFARDAAGAVVGGAVGRTWGECCELQQLWVAPTLRGRGIGSRLVGLFEARAMERGCLTCYLETFSFQAPAFYRRLGYETRAEIAGFAPGIVKQLLLKTLAAP